MITSYQFLNAWVTAHIKSERGASLVEYALLVALIAVVCIAAVTTLGKKRVEQVLDRRRFHRRCLICQATHKVDQLGRAFGPARVHF